MAATVFPWSETVKFECRKQTPLAAFHSDGRLCRAVSGPPNLTVSVPVFLPKVTLATFMDALSRCPEHFESVNRALRKNRLKWGNPKLADFLEVFHAASVWLPEFRLNLVVSRILFPNLWLDDLPAWSGVTHIFVEVFDEHWRVSPQTLRVPIVEKGIVGHRNVTFPTFVNVVASGTFEGMEWRTLPHLGRDPRCCLRRCAGGFDEPLVTFSPVLAEPEGAPRNRGQGMAVWFPFSGKLTVFMIPHAATFEKNWVFLTVNDTSAEMVRALDPLQIISCNLDSGVCREVNGFSQSSTIGPLRPGSQIIEIERNVFVGWARSHITPCGCSDRLYRAHLFVIRRHDRNYGLTDVSGPFDFGVRPTESESMGRCIGRDHYLNAIIPAGIVKWDSSSMTVILSTGPRSNFGSTLWIHRLGQTVGDETY
jgi:beta-1,2-mannosyltransferase